MTKLKKVFATFLALCFMLSLSTTAFASTTENREIPVANADFKRVCNQVFQGNGEVYNTNGVDVTDSFLTKYYGGVTTTHTVSCPIPGIDYITGTLGPFTNVSNFTIEV